MVMNLLGKLTKLEETGEVWGSPTLLQITQSHKEVAICPKLLFPTD